MKVRFTPEAEAQADASDTWWREHREIRDLFARELAATVALLIETPKLGTVYTILHDRPLRKVLCPRRTTTSTTRATPKPERSSSTPSGVLHEDEARSSRRRYMRAVRSWTCSA